MAGDGARGYGGTRTRALQARGHDRICILRASACQQLLRQRACQQVSHDPRSMSHEPALLPTMTPAGMHAGLHAIFATATSKGEKSATASENQKAPDRLI